MSFNVFWVYGEHAGVKYPIGEFPDRSTAEQFVPEYARKKPDEFERFFIEETEKRKPAY